MKASAWAMFSSANSRACSQRSRPLPLTIIAGGLVPVRAAAGPEARDVALLGVGQRAAHARVAELLDLVVLAGIGRAGQVEDGAGFDFELGAVIEDERRDVRPAGERRRDHRGEFRVRRGLIDAGPGRQRVGRMRRVGAVVHPQGQNRGRGSFADVDAGLRGRVVRAGAERRGVGGLDEVDRGLLLRRVRQRGQQFQQRLPRGRGDGGVRRRVGIARPTLV